MKLSGTGRTEVLVSWPPRLEDSQQEQGQPLSMHWRETGTAWASCTPSLQRPAVHPSANMLLNLDCQDQKHCPWEKGLDKMDPEIDRGIIGSVLLFCVYWAQTRMGPGSPIPMKMTQFWKTYWKNKSVLMHIWNSTIIYSFPSWSSKDAGETPQSVSEFIFSPLT